MHIEDECLDDFNSNPTSQVFCAWQLLVISLVNTLPALLGPVLSW